MKKWDAKRILTFFRTWLTREANDILQILMIHLDGEWEESSWKSGRDMYLVKSRLHLEYSIMETQRRKKIHHVDVEMYE